LARESRFDLQGHRGARGLAPENTLPGFRTALSIGVTTLELDTAITRDGTVVVAHDRRLNPDIARRNGRWIEAPTPTVHELDLHELREFDVGRINPRSTYAKRFPHQRGADGVAMPTLSEVFELAAATSVRFNVETKISPLAPGETPGAETFALAVIDVVARHGLQNRVTIQSFDWRTLRFVIERASHIAVSFLTSREYLYETEDSPWTAGYRLSTVGTLPRLVKEASMGARDATWSPNFNDLTAELTQEARQLGLEVLPWTLNDRSQMEAAIGWGVSGLITDYPDLARTALAEQGLELPLPWSV
jgi:glycerophosphoryl diester phosphodiesterase